MIDNRTLPIETPEPAERVFFDDPAAAVERLIQLYERSSRYLLDHFVATLEGRRPEARFRAYCDEVVREQSRLRRSSGTVAYGGL